MLARAGAGPSSLMLVRPPRRLLLLTGSLLLAGCSLLPGGDPPDSSATSATPSASTQLTSAGWKPVDRADVATGGTLRLATGALPKNFNPLHTSNTEPETDRILEPTTGSAIRITQDGGWDVDPDYARSVKIIDREPLTIRVKLNRDAVWQDGTAITATDMVAFWKAQNGSNGKFQVLSTQGYDDIERIDPGSDEYTYTVTFSAPTTDWPRYVYPALPASVSASPKKFNRGFTDAAIASNGPYRTVTVDRDKGQVVQEPNPRWWGAAPRLKQIIWQAATPQLQLKALRAGDLDAVDVSSSRLADVRAAGRDDAVVVERASGTEWTQLTMNGSGGPLKDVRVRRAIALSLDRRAIAESSTGPIGSPPQVLGSFILLPGQQGYTDQSDRIARDPARAAQLLDDAGWKSGAGAGAVRTRKGKKLTLTMPAPATAATGRARSQMIADQLAQIGIEVTVQPVPDDEFFSGRIIPLDFDLATFTQQGGAFPVVAAERLFYPIDSGQNFTGVEDDRLAALWDKAVAQLDDADTARAVAALDKRLFADVPLVPLGVVPQVSLVRRAVANYGPAQFADRDWTSVGFRKKP